MYLFDTQNDGTHQRYPVIFISRCKDTLFLLISEKNFVASYEQTLTDVISLLVSGLLHEKTKKTSQLPKNQQKDL